MVFKAFLKKLTLATLLLSLTTSNLAFANISDLTVQTGCSDQPSYTGLLELESGSYDVYVRLAKRGESATVTAYTQSSFQAYGECDEVGTVLASGDRWTRAGSFSAEDLGSYVTQLSSPVLARIPDANRPSVMLVPQNNPVCIPAVQCEVTVQGQKGYLQPTGVLLNQDSLHALKVEPLRDEDIKEVKYFVDSRLVYKSSSLQPFDMRYVLYPNQKLQRVVVYESGQRVVIESTTPDDYVVDFVEYFGALARTYSTTFQLIAWVVGVFLSLFLVLWVVRLIARHRAWEYAHGVLQHHDRQLSLAQRQALYVKRNIVKWLERGVLGAGVAVGLIITIVLLNTYIMQIFTVDGRSMQRSFKTGDQVLINKFAKTFASINGREYLPLRGEVVVVRGVFGNAPLTSNDASPASELYLIKRVIGLPGERIVVKDGALTVYNDEHPNGFQPDKGSKWEKDMIGDLVSENLDVQLSTSELFLSGDNRPESIDSRFNGPLATKEVVGPMLLRIWPLW